MKQITNNWILNCGSNDIDVVLSEYRFFIKRFPQWFSLLIGRIENQEIRQLLLPNLIDESGSIEGEPSHQDHLNSLIKSIGIDISRNKISEKTKEIEHWFYNLFYEGDLYKCLCVLGPATESVSFQFLNPLEEAIRRNYSVKRIDYTYFEVHRPEVEVKHADDLASAIEIYEHKYLPKNIKSIKRRYVAEGLSKHQEFWDNLNGMISEI